MIFIDSFHERIDNEQAVLWQALWTFHTFENHDYISKLVLWIRWYNALGFFSRGRSLKIHRKKRRLESFADGPLMYMEVPILMGSLEVWNTFRLTSSGGPPSLGNPWENPLTWEPTPTIYAHIVL
jgi:hypothetical protein